MNQLDSTEVKKHDSCQKCWWLWSAVVGFALGALVVFTPFYLHVLRDWDLDEKAPLLLPEIIQTISFYHQIWLVGGIVGALLAVASVGMFQKLKAKSK